MEDHFEQDEARADDAQAEDAGEEEQSPEAKIAYHTTELRRVMVALGIRYVASSQEYVRGESAYTREVVVGILLAGKNHKHFMTDKTAISCLIMLEDKLARENLQSMRTYMRNYNASLGDRPVREFLGFLQNCAPEEVDVLDCAALQSFVWQVKRKFLGFYSNAHPLLLFVRGMQGDGKSRIMEKLCAPLEDWCTGGERLESFDDRGAGGTFSQYYIVRYDDAGEGNLKKKHLGTFKSLITIAKYQFRENYGRRMRKVSVLATCYMTSNVEIAKVIPDDTGARRWWCIDTRPRVWREDVEEQLLRNWPVRDVWDSVDGLVSVNPRTPHLEAFALVQHRDLREVSLPEECLSGGAFERTDNAADKMDQDTLWNEALAWFEEQNSRCPLPKGKFLKKALELYPLKKNGGSSTSSDGHYIFGGLRSKK